MSNELKAINTQAPCLPKSSTYNEITFFWIASKSADLEFDLIPININDDLDFILYKIDPNSFFCEEWDPKRCMARGPNLVDEKLWAPCAGLTGLSARSEGIESHYGCQVGPDNYLSSLMTETGDIYALKVMNFTSFNGFTLNFNKNLSFKPANEFPFATSTLSEDDKQLITSDACIEKIEEVGTSLENVITEPVIKIYPNPTSDKTVITAYNLKFNSYTLYDNTGKIVLKKAVLSTNEITIDMAHLPEGLYIIELYDITGKTFTRQIAKI